MTESHKRAGISFRVSDNDWKEYFGTYNPETCFDTFMRNGLYRIYLSINTCKIKEKEKDIIMNSEWDREDRLEDVWDFMTRKKLRDIDMDRKTNR